MRGGDASKKTHPGCEKTEWKKTRPNILEYYCISICAEKFETGLTIYCASAPVSNDSAQIDIYQPF